MNSNQELSSQELADLKSAKNQLENPMFLIKLTNIVGNIIEKAYSQLPQKYLDKVGKVTKTVLMDSLGILVSNMDSNYISSPKNFLHKGMVTFTGIIGGFFGFVALPFELPITTGLMLRSIIDIARSKGFNINDMDTKLSCLEVLALGGKSKSDDFSESAYYTVRIALAAEMKAATDYLMKKEVTDQSAPAIINFISKIAARFGIIVSDEAMAKSIPIIGSASGGAINLAFITHFQQMAEGHFTVLSLEKKYGKEKIKEIYNKL